MFNAIIFRWNFVYFPKRDTLSNHWELEKFMQILIAVLPESIKWIIEAILSRCRMIWLLPHPHSPHVSTGFRIRINLFRILIQHFRLNIDPDPRFWWPTLKNIYSWKKIWFFWIKNCNLLISIGLHKGHLSYRRSLQPSKMHFKARNFLTFFYFCGSFFPSWIRIRISNTVPDPDPLTLYCRIRIQSGSGYGSETLLATRRDDLLTGEGGKGRKWGRSKSYDGEKATHLYSILSAFSLDIFPPLLKNCRSSMFSESELRENFKTDGDRYRVMAFG